MRTHLLRLVVIGLLLTPAFQGTALAIADTELTCDPPVTSQRAFRYVLSGDLDCTGQMAYVQLGKRDRLELRGHTLKGMHITVGGNVKILGPGTITESPGDGGSGDGIRHSSGLLQVKDVTISNNPRYGIVSLAGKVKLTGVIVTGNGIDGVAVFRSADLRSSTVTGNARFGVSTRPDGTNVEGGASCTETAKSKIVAQGSTITGNGTGAGCGTTEACADLATCARVPKLKASTCDHSYVLESGIPGATLGACSLD